jgi:hypothetical protein
MTRSSALLALGLVALAAVGLGAAEAGKPADDAVFEDTAAHSSATISQVLPNSTTTQTTLPNVKRIRVRDEIFIIEWGDTATTLLPRQYVISIALNKRAAPGG